MEKEAAVLMGVMGETIRMTTRAGFCGQTRRN